MTNHELYLELEKMSAVAGMNQRYHRIKANDWARNDKAVQLTVNVFAVVSMLLSVFSATIQSTTLGWFDVGISIGTFVAAVMLLITPISDRAAYYHDMFRRWCEFREDVDCFQHHVKCKASEANVSDDAMHIRALQGKYHRLNANETVACDEKLFAKCHDGENLSRHGHLTQEEYDQAKAAKVKDNMVPVTAPAAANCRD